MSKCFQFENMNVHEHGISVKNYANEIINHLRGEELINHWKIPDWVYLYKCQILNHLIDIQIINEYTEFHDIGKVECLTIDENGKQHFPNHAYKSYEIWTRLGGNAQAAKCMKMDMYIHTMKSSDIDEFIKNDEAISLLIVGLSEIHSNAKMFGGIDSTSFKIKYKQIDRRGKQICQKIFGNM